MEGMNITKEFRAEGARSPKAFGMRFSRKIVELLWIEQGNPKTGAASGWIAQKTGTTKAQGQARGPVSTRNPKPKIRDEKGVRRYLKFDDMSS